jgi:hypothetical membrane protein
LSTSKKLFWLRVAALCGLVTPVIAISAILLAISYSPWFSWTENALSDLGVHEAAAIFNFSLMTSGVLTLIFAIGLAQTLRQNIMGFVGALLLILTAISLFAIGFFPETAGRIHFYFSVSFFMFTVLSLIVIGVALFRESSGKTVGALSIFAGLFEAAVWVLFWNLPIKGDAIPEMISSLTTSAWSIIMGIKLFMEALS